MRIGVLFDLDGTLLNTLEDLTDSVNYVLRSHGCPERTQKNVRDFIGNGARRLIELSLPGTPDDPDVDTALAEYQAYYKAHSQVKTRPYEGVVEALQELQKSYPVAIVSNKPDGATKVLCRQWFGDVYAAGESADCPRKPAPDMLLRAMEAIGVDRCVYVGDSDVDVITAHNAGAQCLSVLWGFRDRADIEKVGGTHFCEDPKDLLPCLYKLLQEI